jgi:small subunit ribosomal protein S12
MPTVNQLTKTKKRQTKHHRIKSPALEKNPQKKGICRKIYNTKPKKPNSAIRKIVKVKLSNKRFILCYIPGQVHNLQQHSIILVAGGRAPDLPGVKYRCIRGIYDLNYLKNRKTKRSKYGTPKNIQF